MGHPRFIAPCLGAALALAAPAVHAQSTAFSYQGQLKDGGLPANGLHDFRFKLFDAVSGGTQVGATQCVDNVLVTAGTVTAIIDFGNQFSTPAARFIEVEVRRDTGLDCTNTTGFTTLTTRQLLAATPTATHAKSAFSLDAANGSIANAVFVDNTGKVGIGTSTPTHRLHIANAEPTIALQDTDSPGTAGGAQVGYVSYRDSGNIERGWIGYGSPGDPDLSIINARSGGDIVLNPFAGNVGIGTASPAATLDVAGSIRIAAATRWKSIHGSAFSVTRTFHDSGSPALGYLWIADVFGQTAGGVNGYAYTNVGAGDDDAYYAPLELPDGAVITDYFVDALDTDATSDIAVSIGRLRVSDGLVTRVAEVGTAGATNAIQHIGHGAMSEVISNSANAYFVQAQLRMASGIHRLVAVRVKYTVTAPLP